MKTIQCAHPPYHHNGFVGTCRLWTASDEEDGRMTSLYMYYALCFVPVEHSVCREPISVLTNIILYTYIYICIYIYILNEKDKT